MMAPQKLLCFAGFAALCLSLAACGRYTLTSVEAPPGKALATELPLRRAPQQIIVTENDINDRPYTALGDVSVTVRKITLFDNDPTRADVSYALQQKAAKMGADAVVFARYGALGFGAVSPGELEGNGRAIIFDR